MTGINPFTGRPWGKPGSRVRNRIEQTDRDALKHFPTPEPGAVSGARRTDARGDPLLAPRSFRKRPVVIQAMQWTGDSPEMRAAVRAFVDANIDERNAGLKIETLEGWLTVTEGDWIIRGVAGEFYPCKPDIFEATYEAERDLSYAGHPLHHCVSCGSPEAPGPGCANCRQTGYSQTPCPLCASKESIGA